MNNKAILIGIGILAVGLVALPQTLALFQGQHNWYDTTTSINGIPCAKCHPDVVSEIQSTNGTSEDGVNNLHRGVSNDPNAPGCRGCHMVAPTFEGLVQGQSGTSANGFHAAAAPACMDCHDGFNGSGANAKQVFYANEVHKPFVDQANSSSAFLKGANEACIACHTHVKVDITWTKASTIAFSATETTSGNNSHSWNVGNYNAVGTVIFTTSGSGQGTGNSTLYP